MSAYKFILLLNIFRLYPGVSTGQYANLIGLRGFDVLLVLSLLYLVSFKSKPDLRFFSGWLILSLLSITLVGAHVILQPFASVSLPLEIFRIVIFLLVFQFAKCQKIAKEDLMILVRLLAVVLVLLTLFRLFFPDIADIIMYGEKFKTHSGFFRVFPLTTNPNWCGVMLGTLIIFCIAHRMPLFDIGMFSGLLFCTSSRTAILVTVVSIIFVLIAQRRYRVLAVGSLISLSFVYLAFTSLPSHIQELIGALNTIEAFSAIETLALRLSIVEKGLPLMLQSPFLGYGNVREVFGLTDNQYLHWLLFGGIFWLIYNLLFFAFVLIPQNSNDSATRTAAVGIIILLAVACLAGNFLENTQIVVLAILLVQVRVIYNKDEK